MIQDGGLPALRFYVSSRQDDLTEIAVGSLRARSVVAGHLVCVCNATDLWVMCAPRDTGVPYVYCACNGSGLPIYLGRPGGDDMAMGTRLARQKACCPEETTYAIVVAIGYPCAAIPEVGTIEAERATELLVLGKCNRCAVVSGLWGIRLQAPPSIEGDEPWIRRIQGMWCAPDMPRRRRLK